MKEKKNTFKRSRYRKTYEDAMKLLLNLVESGKFDKVMVNQNENN